MKKVTQIVLLVAGTLVLASCSSSVYAPLSKTTGAMYQTGVLGGSVVESFQITATITAVNVSARTISLVGRNGHKATVMCDPNVANFDQLRAGDIVTVIVKDELTMAMADANTPPDTIAKPPGAASRAADSGEVISTTQHYTAAIQAINLKRRQVTLRFPDGSRRKFEVRKDVDLAQRKVGERVAFRITLGTAIAVVKL